MPSRHEKDRFLPDERSRAGTETTEPNIEDTIYPRFSHATLGLFAACIYCTAISNLFLVVAILSPEYGDMISNRGVFSPSGTAFLTVFPAMTVEIAFVTSFLPFVDRSCQERLYEATVLLLLMFQCGRGFCE
jgi:hypothetical protein